MLLMLLMLLLIFEVVCDMIKLQLGRVCVRGDVCLGQLNHFNIGPGGIKVNKSQNSESLFSVEFLRNKRGLEVWAT